MKKRSLLAALPVWLTAALAFAGPSLAVVPRGGRLLLQPASLKGGALAQVTLEFDAALPDTLGFLVSLSGTNSAQASSTRLEIRAGERSTIFRVATSVAQDEEFVDITVSDTATQSSVATARLVVNAAALVSLSLNRSVSVGGTPDSAVTGAVTLDGPAGAQGTIVLLGQSCPTCGPVAALDLPQSVRVPPRSTGARFTAQPRKVTNPTSVTVLASLGGVVRTAGLVVDTLRPASVTASPASVSGLQATTLTVTLNAPAYEGYNVQVQCNPLLETDFPGTPHRCGSGEKSLWILVPLGQSSVSLHAHAVQPPASPALVTIKSGTVQATLTLAP